MGIREGGKEYNAGGVPPLAFLTQDEILKAGSTKASITQQLKPEHRLIKFESDLYAANIRIKLDLRTAVLESNFAADQILDTGYLYDWSTTVLGTCFYFPMSGQIFVAPNVRRDMAADEVERFDNAAAARNWFQNQKWNMHDFTNLPQDGQWRVFEVEAEQTKPNQVPRFVPKMPNFLEGAGWRVKDAEVYSLNARQMQQVADRHIFQSSRMIRQQVEFLATTFGVERQNPFARRSWISLQATLRHRESNAFYNMLLDKAVKEEMAGIVEDAIHRRDQEVIDAADNIRSNIQSGICLNCHRQCECPNLGCKADDKFGVPESIMRPIRTVFGAADSRTQTAQLAKALLRGYSNLLKKRRMLPNPTTDISRPLLSWAKHPWDYTAGAAGDYSTTTPTDRLKYDVRIVKVIGELIERTLGEDPEEPLRLAGAMKLSVSEANLLAHVLVGASPGTSPSLVAQWVETAAEKWSYPKIAVKVREALALVDCLRTDPPEKKEAPPTTAVSDDAAAVGAVAADDDAQLFCADCDIQVDMCPDLQRAQIPFGPRCLDCVRRACGLCELCGSPDTTSDTSPFRCAACQS